MLRISRGSRNLTRGKCAARSAGSGAHAAEHRERIAGNRFPDELAAGLGPAVQPRGERVRVFLRRCTDDDVAEAANNGVALSLERVGELAGLVVRTEPDPDLPRRVAAVELLLFPGLAGRLVVPALLVLQPMLDPRRARCAAEAPQLRLDH